jgi:cytochrome P450
MLSVCFLLFKIGNSLSLLMSVMARNPEAQEKLHQEIVSLLDPGEPITAKFLQNAKYLKACVQESFR